MNNTRRGFLASLAGLLGLTNWLPGQSKEKPVRKTWRWGLTGPREVCFRDLKAGDLFSLDGPYGRWTHRARSDAYLAADGEWKGRWVVHAYLALAHSGDGCSTAEMEEWRSGYAREYEGVSSPGIINGALRCDRPDCATACRVPPWPQTISAWRTAWRLDASRGIQRCRLEDLRQGDHFLMDGLGKTVWRAAADAKLGADHFWGVECEQVFSVGMSREEAAQLEAYVAGMPVPLPG